MLINNNLFFLLLLSSSILISRVTSEKNYCRGEFAPTASICKKFEFDKLTDNGICTDSSKKSSVDKFHGLKLANCTTFYDISMLPSEKMHASAIKKAELITNVFENGNTKMGYAAVEKLGDCRGYTCGYIGFTTGTNDAYAVVKEYVRRVPKAKLRKYLKALEALTKLPFGDPRRDDTSQLSGFASAWKEAACKDPNFVQTQLDVGHSMYLKPALKYAASVHVKSNLGKAIFYDTIIQHGWQYVEPYINIVRIIQLTGPRKSGESEKSYLLRFLATRQQLMCCYPGSVWNDSADRVEDLRTLVKHWSKNKNLKHTVELKIYGAKITGKENMKVDSKRCKHDSKKKSASEKKVKSISLPIPDTCPAK